MDIVAELRQTPAGLEYSPSVSEPTRHIGKLCHRAADVIQGRRETMGLACTEVRILREENEKLTRQVKASAALSVACLHFMKPDTLVGDVLARREVVARTLERAHAALLGDVYSPALDGDDMETVAAELAAL